MSRTTKVLRFSVPPTVVEEVEQSARQERRTKSELFREMWRVYRRYLLLRDRDEGRRVMTLIEEARTEQARNPAMPEELLAEDERLTRYGVRQARRLGIEPEDTDRLIHEHRKVRRAQGRFRVG
jgi:metal-responsive CopG/Arc/MetJ family transcriptional regulator